MSLSLPNIALQNQKEQQYKDAMQTHWKNQDDMAKLNHEQKNHLHNPKQILAETQAKEDPVHFNKYYDDLKNKAHQAETFKGDLEQMLHMLDNGDVITSDNLYSDIRQWLSNIWGGEQKGKQQTFDQLGSAFLPKLKEIFQGRITDLDLKLGEARMFAGQGKHKDANRMLIKNALQAMEHVLDDYQGVNQLLEDHDYQVPMGAVYKFENERRKKRRSRSSNNTQNVDTPQTIRIKGPDGSIRSVPQDKAEQFLKAKGFSRV